MSQNAGHIARAEMFLRELGVTDIGTDRLRGVGRGTRDATMDLTNPYGELCLQCWSGKLCITPSGQTYPCVFARSVALGDARDGLEPILASARLARFREDVYRLDARRRRTAEADGAAVRCIPGSCNPGDFCSPYQCYPQTGPCDPVCNPVTCMPANGPCYPAG